MLSNGEDIIAEIPMEHLPMYLGTKHFKRINTIMELGGTCECCYRGVSHFLLIKHGSMKRFSLYTELYHELTIDHIKPRFLGGGNSKSNYQVLCLFCNRAKGSMDISIQELRELIKSVV